MGFLEQTELRKQINDSFIVLPVWVDLLPATKSHGFSSHSHELKSKSQNKTSIQAQKIALGREGALVGSVLLVSSLSLVPNTTPPQRA